MSIPFQETINQKPRKSKSVFTKEEDQQIIDFVEKFGAKRWERIELLIPNRTSRQCRERWKNSLSAELVNNPWTGEEDFLLEALVGRYGQKWSEIKEYFPGRTDVNIKNRFCLLQRHIKKGKRKPQQFIVQNSGQSSPVLSNNFSEIIESLEPDPSLENYEFPFTNADSTYDFQIENPTAATEFFQMYDFI
jgi:hypothetical protein